MRRPYEFAILRYIFDQVSGEFVNIGVILRTVEDGQIEIIISKRWERLSNFFRNGFSAFVFKAATDSVRSRVEEVLPSLNRYPRGSVGAPVRSLSDVLPMLAPLDPTVLQWSDVMGGVHPNPMSLTESLFEEFVGRHMDERRNPRRQEDEIWNAISGTLHDMDCATVGDLRFDDESTTEEFGRVRHRFRARWDNRVPQYLDSISFDLLEPQSVIDKAVRWLGMLSALAQGKREFKITGILAPPSEPSAASAFDEAKAIIKSAKQVRGLMDEGEGKIVIPTWIRSDIEARKKQAEQAQLDPPR